MMILGSSLMILFLHQNWISHRHLTVNLTGKNKLKFDGDTILNFEVYT